MCFQNKTYPFAAIVGQDQLKMALLLNAVNPAIGGVLIRGEKGTAKSTAVRALAGLLPQIRVVQSCAFCCDPARPEELCVTCRAHADRLLVGRRRIPVVTLPLNATEDRVAGGIDFNLAVKRGARILQPGLLAKAHRGILYVDEVNLLDDHLVDIILDVAASGKNVIEREGMSFSHASRFILVGTMNPEEGELRPQLLDRFGLCVDVCSEKDLTVRTELMARRDAFDEDPGRFVEQYGADNEKIAGRILAGRNSLPKVALPGNLRTLICDLCVENNVAGHRADLVIEQAAKALAAFREHNKVGEEDIQEVAQLALSHRRREPAPPQFPPRPEQNHDHNHENPHDGDSEDPREEKETTPEDKQESLNGEDSRPQETSPSEENEEGPESNLKQMKPNQTKDVLEQIFDVGKTFKVKKLAVPKDRIVRRGSGRRSRTRISQKQGRYVKSALASQTNDVALDATLRAAAPYQLRRKNGNGLKVVLQPEDIRAKVREKRIGNFLLFVVDASGSMGARGRMAASKGAIMSLLLDAYQKRDRVAMVSFRKDEAVVNLPPTSSIELAATLLRDMPVGGRTPLSAGLAKTYEVLRNYLLREPTARPIALIITDGRSNVSMGERKPLDEAAAFAERLSMDCRIRFIVVDTEAKGLMTFGFARNLASTMNAQYFRIEDLEADTLVNIAKGET